MRDDLLDAQVAVDWAESQVDLLQESLIAWRKDTPYRWIEAPDPDSLHCACIRRAFSCIARLQMRSLGRARALYKSHARNHFVADISQHLCHAGCRPRVRRQSHGRGARNRCSMAFHSSVALVIFPPIKLSVGS